MSKIACSIEASNFNQNDNECYYATVQCSGSQPRLRGPQVLLQKSNVGVNVGLFFENMKVFSQFYYWVLPKL